MRIALLFHKNDRNLRLERYYITFLAELWRADGHEVVFVFGADAYTPADIALLHVNLSVVPDEYIALAERYPIALNHRARDIRKSTISTQLLPEESSWDGAVIVKSNYNYAGRPESELSGRWIRGRNARRIERLRARLWGRKAPGSQDEYEVFDTLSEVPSRHFNNDRVVVEKFHPERDGEFYVVHTLHFLGQKFAATRLWSRDPIVTQENIEGTSREEPHPEVVALRDDMGFDYGKFDFVMKDGRPIVFDTNKTVGGAPSDDPGVIERRRLLASGLYDYTG